MPVPHFTLYVVPEFAAFAEYPSLVIQADDLVEPYLQTIAAELLALVGFGALWTEPQGALPVLCLHLGPFLLVELLVCLVEFDQAQFIAALLVLSLDTQGSLKLIFLVLL